MILRPLTPGEPTWFAFPVERETLVYHDNGSGARWHVAILDGSPVVSDGWRVFYGIDYNEGTNKRPRLAWDRVPPLYVQAAAFRLCESLRFAPA